MKYEVSKEQHFELKDYPVKEYGDFKKLEAETLYYYKNDETNEGRWMAGLLLDTKYGKRIGIYKWSWRRPKKQSGDKWVPDNSNPFRWFLDEKVNINKLDYWDKLRTFVDEVFVE